MRTETITRIITFCLAYKNPYLYYGGKQPLDVVLAYLAKYLPYRVAVDSSICHTHSFKPTTYLCVSTNISNSYTTNNKIISLVNVKPLAYLDVTRYIPVYTFSVHAYTPYTVAKLRQGVTLTPVIKRMERLYSKYGHYVIEYYGAILACSNKLK